MLCRAWYSRTSFGQPEVALIADERGDHRVTWVCRTWQGQSETNDAGFAVLKLRGRARRGVEEDPSALDGVLHIRSRARLVNREPLLFDRRIFYNAEVEPLNVLLEMLQTFAPIAPTRCFGRLPGFSQDSP